MSPGVRPGSEVPWQVASARGTCFAEIGLLAPGSSLGPAKVGVVL